MEFSKLTIFVLFLILILPSSICLPESILGTQGTGDMGTGLNSSDLVKTPRMENQKNDETAGRPYTSVHNHGPTLTPGVNFSLNRF
jgi:hypothetical protein